MAEQPNKATELGYYSGSCIASVTAPNGKLFPIDRRMLWPYSTRHNNEIAYRILFHHLSDIRRATALCEPFASEILAQFGPNDWRLSIEDLDAWITKTEAEETTNE